MLDLVRERISQLKNQYMIPEDGEDEEEEAKLAGKRQGGSLEDLEDEIRSGEGKKEAEGKPEEEGKIVEGEEEKEEKEEEEEEEEKEGEEDEEEVDEPDLNEYLEDSDEEEEGKSGEEAEGDEDEIERQIKLQEAKNEAVVGVKAAPALDAKAKDGGDDEAMSSDSEDEGNNQGFIDVGDIDTFKKPKRERIKEAIALQVKETHKHVPKRKTGSTTNTEKLKNKPYMMVQPKKKHDILRAKYKSIKERIREMQKKSRKVRKGKLKVQRKIYIRSSH